LEAFDCVMIVRPAEESVHLVTQPDHAALAREIMEHCVALAELPRRASILHAIGEHDNGWREPDETPDIDPTTGAILDFVRASAEVRQGVWPRAVARLRDDPWAAALVAEHALVVYDGYRSDADWVGFFTTMKASRDGLIVGTGLELDELQSDYRFVRLGDLVSLAFCAAWSEPQRCYEWSVQFDGLRVVVRPDPFGGLDVPFEVSARELAAASFEFVEEFRAALRRSPVVSLRGTASGH
jgi:hypothetical protein